MLSNRTVCWMCLGAFCAAAASAPAETGYHYFYFKQPRELQLNAAKVAIQATPAQLAAPAQTASIRSFRLDGLRDGPVAGWTFAGVPIERQAPGKIDELTAALVAEGVGFVSPVFVGEDGGPVIVLPEVLMQFDPSVTVQRRRTILAEVGLTVVDEDWANMPRAYRVRSESRSGLEVLRTANELAMRPEVLFAEPNVLFSGRGGFVPNDPLFGDQWEHDNTGQLGGNPDMDMDTPEAWDITTGDPSILVVVLDVGVQATHPDINQVPGADFTGEGGGGAPVNPCDNHGTSVAGCVSAAINNGIGVVGSAPNCRAASARTFISDLACNGDWFSEAAWTVDALAWAETIGTRVTNNSNIYGFTSSAIASKYDSTRAAGMVHFASAGNNGTPQIAYPANLPSVMALGATDRFGNRASFSNWGPGIDYTAPGDDVRSTDRTGNAGWVPGDYVVIDGTSFASPYAAGVAALVLSVRPWLAGMDVEAILAETATDLGAEGKDSNYGWGVVNAFNAVTFDPCEVEAVLPEPAPLEKNRYIAFVPGTSWTNYAIRVELTELMRPSPANQPCCPPPDFSAFEGEYRWVGPLQTCPDSPSQGTTFLCATLQCAPHYQNWSAVAGQVVYVTGREIVPSSLYRAQVVNDSCPIDDEANFTAALELRTARWGDVTLPYQDPEGPASQPNAMDIAAVVDRVKDLPGAATKMRAQLQPAALNPQSNASATDIGAAVSAVKGIPYYLSGPTACP